jgi:hypothetical protein
MAFSGDTEKGFEGLFNYTGVPSTTATADGTGSSALWADKTPAQIIRDLNDMLTGMGTATNYVEIADTVILPQERLGTLASTQMTNTQLSVLEFFRQSNVYTAQTGQPLTIRGKRNMLTIGSGSTARMIAYRRAPDVLKLHIPMPHRFFPVQIDGFQFTIPGMFRLGGLDIRLPKAVTYVDGV